jgi:hypothetical protein
MGGAKRESSMMSGHFRSYLFAKSYLSKDLKTNLLHGVKNIPR